MKKRNKNKTPFYTSKWRVESTESKKNRKKETGFSDETRENEEK
jgi:hypothetical protein